MSERGPRQDDWVAGIPSASAQVVCGSSTHTILWESGRLRLVDHDVEAERALVALGGESCPCVDLLSAWERYSSDPAVLILGPRDLLALSGADWKAARRQARDAARPRGKPPRHIRQSARPIRSDAVHSDGTLDERLETLLQLSGAIPHRLVGTVAAALTARTHDRDLWSALRAALHSRVAATIERWSPADPEFVLEMTSEGDHSLSRDPGGGLVVRLPFSWLRDVWARELSVITGEFVLSAHVHEPGLLEVVSVDRRMVVHREPFGYEVEV